MNVVRGTLSVLNFDGVTRAYTTKKGGRLIGQWDFDETTVTLSCSSFFSSWFDAVCV
jgi:hypothetical protein